MLLRVCDVSERKQEDRGIWSRSAQSQPSKHRQTMNASIFPRTNGQLKVNVVAGSARLMSPQSSAKTSRLCVKLPQVGAIPVPELPFGRGRRVSTL